jgi:hypothetical protein
MNDNPVVQAALVGVLLLAFAFILFTRVLGGSEPAAESPPATPGVPAPATGTSAGPATDATDPASPSPAAPAESGGAAPVTPSDSAAPAPAPAGTVPGSFEAGKGLPKAVVDAYDENKVVVLLVVVDGGLDDKRVEQAAKSLEDRSDVALFVTSARNVAEYSRITNGVGLSRTPALVVLRPKDISGDVPRATVDYGYRSLQSIEQAVRDAKYDGKDQPYYPE